MTTLVESIKPDILTVLATGNKSISQIAQDLGVNYYTVRNAVRDLVNDRQIITLGYPGTRNVKYGLQDSEDFLPASTNTIPRVIIGGKSHRLNSLLSLRSNKETLASVAALSIPKHISRLCVLAQRFNNDDQTAQFALEALRIEVTKDYEALLKAAELYKQILNNKRNWNPKDLSTWTNDPSYDEKEVQDSYDQYNS